MCEAARAELDAGREDSAAWQRLLDHLDNDGRSADRCSSPRCSARRDQWLRHVIVGDAAALRARLEQALGAEIDAAGSTPSRRCCRGCNAADARPRALRRRNISREPMQRIHSPPGAQARRAAGYKLRESLDHWQLDRRLAARRRTGISTPASTLRRAFHPRARARGRQRPRRDAHKQAMIAACCAAWRRCRSLAAALHGVRRTAAAALRRRRPGASSRRCSRCYRAPRRGCSSSSREARAIDFIEATARSRCAPWVSPTRRPTCCCDWTCASNTCSSTNFRTRRCRSTSSSSVWSPAGPRVTAGRLFVVGDPMQSVYGFREAEVGLYLDAQRQRRLGEVALEPLVLQCNFRSQCDLVGWVNRVFRAGDRRIAAPDRSASSSRSAPPPQCCRQSLRPPLRSKLAPPTPMKQRRWSPIFGRRWPTCAEVAILVRKRGDLAEILPALRGAGIPFAAVDLDRMADRQTILDLASLTHALIQPDDRLAWLAVLRAPWCGLTLPDVFALDGAAGGRSLCEAIVAHQAPAQVVPASMSADGAHRLQRLAAAIAPAVARSRPHAARCGRPRGLARPRRTGLRRGAERSGGCRAIFHTAG